MDGVLDEGVKRVEWCTKLPFYKSLQFRRCALPPSFYTGLTPTKTSHNSTMTVLHVDDMVTTFGEDLSPSVRSLHPSLSYSLITHSSLDTLSHHHHYTQLMHAHPSPRGVLCFRMDNVLNKERILKSCEHPDWT
jgi:hypothetical protein